jgi:hypothetical protein
MNVLEAAYEGMRQAVQKLACPKCRRMLVDGKCAHCEKDK